MHNERLQAAFEYIKDWKPNKKVILKHKAECTKNWQPNKTVILKHDTKTVKYKKPKTILTQLKKENHYKAKNNDEVKAKTIKLLSNNESLTVTPYN